MPLCGTNGEDDSKMRFERRFLTALLINMGLVLCLSGCSMLSGPSDEEVVKAVTETGLFASGEERFSLKSPMVVVEKAMFSSRGGWPVKVKLHYSYLMAGGRETKPVEKVQSFLITRVTDSAGNTRWKAIAGTK